MIKKERKTSRLSEILFKHIHLKLIALICAVLMVLIVRFFA
ncbi:MAG: hypothetical protein PHX51_05980 [Clostridia bacterium]|nr:hypothetical protein [Clostridia bacterium]